MLLRFVFGPPCRSSPPSGLGAFLAGHLVSTGTSTLQTTLAAKCHSSRILPCVRIEWRLISYRFGNELRRQLIHVRRAVTRAFRHALDGTTAFGVAT